MNEQSASGGAALWQRAAGYAARAHRHATRKDGQTPYVAHPFRVAMTIRHVFGHEDDVTLAAALLHDTIEDTGSDYDAIEEEFGTAVADLVAAMTKNMALPEREREPAYDQQLAAADWRARLIKLADQYDNLADALEGNRSIDKTLDKAQRALDLAQADVASHPEARRAVGALRELMETAHAGSRR